MKKCSCGKQIEDKYDKCYDCYRKQNEVKHHPKDDGFVDMNKKYEMQLWLIVLIFIAGAIIGGWLF